LPGSCWTKVVARIAAAFAAVLLALPVHAQVDQGRALAAIEACEDLGEALAKAQGPQSAPRLAQGDYSDEFQRALDTSIAGEGVQTPAGMALLIDLQREAGALVRAYLLLGIKANALSSDLSGEQAARNFLTFLPEMAALYDYRLRIGSLISQSAAALPGPMPDPRISVAVAAIAMEQEKVLLSAIAVSSDPQIDPDWRAERVKVLSEAVPGFTALLGRKKAQEIADTALIAARAEQDPRVALQLKDFALALLR
jgi:hypothetical protein